MTELGVNPKFGASAPKAFKGWQLIQKYGCFGCHEIHGQDAGVAIGPDLRLEPQTRKNLARIASRSDSGGGQASQSRTKSSSYCVEDELRR